MNGFLPRTLIEAASFADPTFVGGATDIMPLIRNEVRDDENLILLKNIPELKELRDTPEHIVIGSGVRLAELARSELINTRCAAVAQAAAVTASPQIRNIATIGGNVMQDRRCIYFNQSEQWRGALPLCYKTGGEVCHQIPNSPVCRAITILTSRRRSLRWTRRQNIWSRASVAAQACRSWCSGIRPAMAVRAMRGSKSSLSAS